MHFFSDREIIFPASFELNVECGAVSCPRVVCVSACLFSADFREPSLWPISSPYLYLLVLGSSLKACIVWFTDSSSIPSRRHYDLSIGCSLQFTFSIENRSLYFEQIFLDPCAYYLSQFQMISYCLLAWLGFHQLGNNREIRLAVSLFWVYPGASRLVYFSGYASIFCTAAWRHPALTLTFP